MLVLTRRPGESISFTGVGEVKITLIETQGKKTRIGIEAPDSVVITRSELLATEKCAAQDPDPVTP